MRESKEKRSNGAMKDLWHGATYNVRADLLAGNLVVGDHCDGRLSLKAVRKPVWRQRQQGDSGARQSYGGDAIVRTKVEAANSGSAALALY